jgi:hypothetical protein
MIVSLHPEMHAAVGKQKPKSQSRKVYDSEDGDRFTNAVAAKPGKSERAIPTSNHQAP